jgi:hypothetical protein
VRTLGSLSLVAVCFVAFACAPKTTSPTATPGAAASAYPGYGQPGAPAGYPQAGAPAGYPQQGAPAGYPQQGAPAGYPQQAAPGTVPAPMPGAASSAAPLATPGPLALPCTSDSACGLAHCNTQYGKCAFPCQQATDCISGATCNTMTGLCLPGGAAH